MIIETDAVAAVIDARLFERIRRMQERFDALSARLGEAYATVPEEEGMAEMQRAVAKERAASGKTRTRKNV